MFRGAWRPEGTGPKGDRAHPTPRTEGGEPAFLSPIKVLKLVQVEKKSGNRVVFFFLIFYHEKFPTYSKEFYGQCQDTHT